MDLPYVFGEPFRADNPEVNDQFFYNGLEYNDEDREFSYFMLTMYANFAKYGWVSRIWMIYTFTLAAEIITHILDDRSI